MSQHPVFITRQAIDRFIQWHAPHMSKSEAARHLEQTAATAAHLKERTTFGQQQWQIEDPHCVLVMKQDGRKLICVTVLPEAERPDVIEDAEGHSVPMPRARRPRR